MNISEELKFCLFCPDTFSDTVGREDTLDLSVNNIVANLFCRNSFPRFFETNTFAYKL